MMPVSVHIRWLHGLTALILMIAPGCGGSPAPIPPSPAPSVATEAPTSSPARNTVHAATRRPLDLATRTPSDPFVGHAHSVRKLRYSADGRWLASVAENETSIKLWDVATGTLRHELSGHTGPVLGLEFTPDSATLASVSPGPTIPAEQHDLPQHPHGEVKLWDVATGRPRRPPVGDIMHPAALAISSDGEKLVVAGSHQGGEQIRIWNVETRKLKPLNISRSNNVLTRAVLIHDKAIHLFTAAGTMDRFSLAEGWELGGNALHRQAIQVVAISPDRRWLATGSVDQTLTLVALGRPDPDVILRGFQHPITSVSFSADSTTLAATAAGERQVLLWDLENVTATASRSGTRPFTILPQRRLQAPESIPTESFGCAAFSATGKILMTGLGPHLITWDLSGSMPELQPFRGVEQEQLATLESHQDRVLRLEFSPDSQRLASWSADHVLKVWDLARRREINPFRNDPTPLGSWAFSPDLRTIATGADRPGKGERFPPIKIWNLSEGLKRSVEVVEASAPLGVLNAIRALAYSSDGTILASVTADGMARIWNPETLQDNQAWIDAGTPLLTCKFTPDGKTLVLLGARGDVILYKVSPPEFGHRFEVDEERRVVAVRLSGDGRTLAVLTTRADERSRREAQQRGIIQLWDLSDLQSRGTLEISFDGSLDMAFSPDGATLAITSPEPAIRLWDLKTLRPRATLQGHLETITSLSYSPKGTILASASQDRTLKFWDPATGRLLASRDGHLNAIAVVRFSPDGSLVATGSHDRTVRLWKPPTLSP